MSPEIYLTFAILGLGAGAMYTGITLGIILTYRGSGVVNFANGALALFIAYVFYGLRVDGTLQILPLPNPLSLVEGMAGWFGASIELWDIPTSVKLSDGGMGIWMAGAISIGIAIAIGWIVNRAIFQPIRTASPLTKVVASVGLMLLLQGIISLRYGTESLATPPLLPGDLVEIAGTPVPQDRLWITGGAIVLTILLALLFKFTYVGLATRASADNERAAMYMGLSPSRLGSFNWMLSSAIAGLVGICFSSIIGLNPIDMVLMIVPALGAALLARFTSFGVAAAAAFGIGVLQSLLLPIQTQFSWLPSTGLSAALPFVIIAVAMLVLGVGVPTRASAIGFKLPRATRPSHPWRMTIILAGIAAALIIWLPFDIRAGLINSLAFMVVAASLYVLVGLAGQISLMQMAVVGLSALAMTRTAGDWGLSFPVASVLAIAVGTAFGIGTATFALRVRGVELAVLTLSAAWAFEAIVLGNEDFLRLEDQGNKIPAPSLLGFEFGPSAPFPFGSGGTPSAWFGLFVLVVTIACITAAMMVRRSRVGLRFLAMRSNERAATALGVNLRTNKLLAFAISSLIASVAGVLSGYRFGAVSPGQFSALMSVLVLAAAFIGGISMISGVIVAGLGAVGGLMSVLIEHVVDYGDLEVVVTSVLLIVVAVQQPEGIAGFNEQAFYHFRDKIRRRFAKKDSDSARSVSQSAGVGATGD